LWIKPFIEALGRHRPERLFGAPFTKELGNS